MAVVQSRSYASIPHLVAAARSRAQILTLEIATRASPSEVDVLTHRGMVMASLASSVSALESMINELVANAGDTTHPHAWTFGNVPTANRAALAASKPKDVKGVPSVLTKFDDAHFILTGQHLDDQSIAYAATREMIFLRNTFVHFYPQWRQHNDPQEKFVGKLSFLAKLQGKFAENTLATSNSPFYPDRVLGHGCVKWAFGTTLSFADAFWLAVGLNAPYEDYRQMLAA